MPYVPLRKGLAVIATMIIVLVLLALVFEGYEEDHRLWAHAAATTGGDPERGEAVFIADGCGSCHHLYHIPKATGLVGPPLDQIALRAMIAGKLTNTPDNLQQWIQNPQAITPGTDMPNLNVNARDARDITAFLYTRT